MRHQSIAIIHAAILALIFIPSLLEAQTTHTIMVLDNEFDPPMITIPAGDTVRWVNPQNLGAEHDVVSEDGLWTPPAVADAWTFSHTVLLHSPPGPRHDRGHPGCGKPRHRGGL
jgi:plastocyanin